MRYALIGCGRISTNHILAAKNNHLEIAAVCDIRPEAMENVLAKHGLEQDPSIARYTDYIKMLDEVKPTLVSIATESGIHGQIALACIDRGIHVIIEKPMAMSMAEADLIIRRSREKHVKVAACHQNRFNIAVQELRRALESGAPADAPHGVKEEAGDVLFIASNVARMAGVEGEEALHCACDKFVSRFRQVEQQAKQPLNAYSRDQLLALWENTKES